jgi:hypothetical protein
VAALGVWAGAAFSHRFLIARARRGGPQAELHERRRRGWLVTLAHAALLLGLAAGWGLMQRRGWSFGHPGWLGVKLGLTLAVIVPLEGLHAWVAHVWMRQGLAQTPAPPFSKDLRRAVSVEDMLAVLALPLLGLALPLIAWLSLARPF